MSEYCRVRVALIAPLVASGLLVSGCMSSPTYGTDKTANEQLTSDLTGMLSLKPKSRAAEYKPRPELVKPTNPTTELPPPQENIVTASAGLWPESPEEQRARIRANATANSDNPNYESEIINDVSSARETRAPATSGAAGRASESGLIDQADARKRADKFKQQVAATKQGSPTVRRTLTEPPLEYRLPAETAPTDELGEDEFKKARRLKAEAKKGNDKSWRDLVPWL